MFLGFIDDGGANTNPQRFHVQFSGNSTGDEDWTTVATYTATQTGTPAREALTGASLSDDTMEVASTTGFTTIGMAVYIQDSSVVTDGEWNYVETYTTDTSIDLYDVVTTAKDSADFINEAQIWTAQFDLSGVLRMRVVFENEGATAADCHAKARVTTADSIA
jgi:hypothetical protein